MFLISRIDSVSEAERENEYQCLEEYNANILHIKRKTDKALNRRTDWIVKLKESV